MKRIYIAYYKVGNGWQFQLMAYNHEAVMTSQVYKQKASMNKAIEIVLNSRIAEIKETKNRNHEDFDLYD